MCKDTLQHDQKDILAISVMRYHNIRFLRVEKRLLSRTEYDIPDQG